MCEISFIKRDSDYSIIGIQNGKVTKTIIALHKIGVESSLKGKFNVKLGSPIKENTMKKQYPEVLEAINFRKTDRFRFVDDLGKLS